MDARVVDVAVPLPLHTTFTYRVPEGMAHAGARGAGARALRAGGSSGVVTGRAADPRRPTSS